MASTRPKYHIHISKMLRFKNLAHLLLFLEFVSTQETNGHEILYYYREISSKIDASFLKIGTSVTLKVIWICLSTGFNHIYSVMASVLTSCTLDYGFESWSGQIKDHKISISCFSAKHTVIKSWLGNRIICLSGATGLPAECNFRELAL